MNIIAVDKEKIPCYNKYRYSNKTCIMKYTIIKSKYFF